MKKSKLVVKHNSLIRSRYDYTLAELRLVLTVASMIGPEDEDFRDYVVRTKDFSDLVESSHKDEYKRLQDLGEMLLSKTLKIPEPDGFVICNWFSSFKYINGEGTITVRFDPVLKPYLLQLQEMFTKYNLENILRFKSAYSIRIYEIAKSWEARGEFNYPVEEFKEMIGAAKKYTAYYDFKRYVIERALKEINSLSDIRLTFKEKKLARKVTDLVFTIKPRRKEGEADYLATRRAFIAYVRRHYKPDSDRGIYPSILTTSSGTLKIDNDGKLYISAAAGTLPGTLDHVQSDKLWSWMYNGVKNGDFELIPPPEAGG